MHDLKRQKKRRMKGNRRLGEKQQRDWKRIFHRTLRTLLVTCSAVLVISGGVLVAQILFDSGYFGVEQIEIVNLQRLEADEIIAESNIKGGDNIFLLDLDAIGRKIEENPWVSRAEVGRVFPREIVIRIAEREARAIINLGYLYYVDSNAEIFKVLSADDRLDYPVITGIDRDYLLENPEQGREMLETATAVIDRLAERTVFTLDQVSEIHVSRENSIMLTTYHSGVPVQLGYQGYRAKLDRLERIFPELESKLPVLKGIDLNVTDRVIVKIDQKFTTGKS